MNVWNGLRVLKKSILFMMICFSLCLTGCSFWDMDEYEKMELTQEEIETAKKKPIPTGSAESVAMKILSIYTVDSVEEQLVPIRVRMNTERVTPEFILDEVLTNLEEKVVVEECSVENRRIYVVLNETYAPMNNCSKRFERLILDCISNSLLDNIEYIDEVVFQGKKGAYESENFSFEKDEAYSSK